MKKFVLFSAVAGAMILAASNASAVMGVFTISGTFENQSTNKSDVPIVQKNSFSEKNLLFILAQGTGDQSITNKPTKIYYDPDAYNSNATIWVEGQGGNTTVHGIFYYSNSVAGLVPLDGVNGSSQYYSYMEFDFYNSIDGIFNYTEGFWNQMAVEANSVSTFTANGFTEDGNALLYIHSNPYWYDLPGNWYQNLPSTFFFANTWFGTYSDFALVIHGTVTFKVSFSETKNTTVEMESFTLKGSGDGLYNDIDGIVTGTATFSGKGPDELILF